MAPSSAKQRRPKKNQDETDADGGQRPESGRSRRERKARLRAWLIGGSVLGAVVFLFAYDQWHAATREANEIARIIGCGWDQCADAATKSMLETMARMASERKGFVGQELSPERAMWSYCLKTCMDSSDKQASALAVKQVEPLLSAAAAQRDACAGESDWTIEIGSSVERTTAIIDVVPEAAAILARCGLVRLNGLWKESDSVWMEQSLAGYNALSSDSIWGWGRIEPKPRPTQDVLVPKHIWEVGVSRFISHPTIAGAVAKYFNETDMPRLSYASWIVAPSSDKKVELHPQKTHSDADTPKSMVSVHLALEDITASMGPTGYCPGTHIPGAGVQTEPAGPAGPLELHFALRYIALNRQTQSCKLAVPKRTRKGTVTIYDSALVHRGEPNHASRPRVLLNLNVAAAQSAIDHENYFAYFKDKSSKDEVRKHLSWYRSAFGREFYEELLQPTTTDRESYGQDVAMRRFRNTLQE